MVNFGGKPQLAYGEMREKLEPDDVDGKVAILTIATVQVKDLSPENSRRGPQNKIILTFEEFPDKDYVVNSTSYKTLVDKLGKNHDEWIGERVVMAPTTNTFQGQAFEKIHVATPERWNKMMRAEEVRDNAKGGDDEPGDEDEEDDMPTSVPRAAKKRKPRR